jgi:multiple sugar transport system substrate-binding protein
MNGRQYALPFEVNPKLMAVNKTLLQREGYDVPSLDWKWNDFYDLCYHLTRDLDGDGQKDIFGVCNYKWTDAVYSNGARLFDRDGSKAYFNDAGVIEAVKFMQRLNDLNNDIKLTKDDFDMGKVAFMPLTFAEYKTYTTYPYKIEKYMDLNWSFITLPAGPSGDNVSVADSLLMGISSNSSHEQLAYRLLKTFTADSEIQLDIYNYGHGASALKEAASSPQVEKIMQDKMAENDMNYDSNLIIQVLDNSMFCPVFSKYDELMALANNTIEHIISEDENAESSLRKFQRDILKLIE